MPRFPRGGSGSGGTEFPFDSATFTPSEYIEGSGGRSVTIQLTLDGSPISEQDIAVWLFLTDSLGEIGTGSDVDFEYLGDGSYAEVVREDELYVGFIVEADSSGEIEFEYENDNVAEDVLTVGVLLPSGGYVSEDVTLPASS